MLKFFFVFLISFNAMSARMAIVTKAKAIIYADGNLESPIGYISKNKKIFIGNKNYKSDKVTTVAVSGKIGFIKTADLLIDSAIFAKDFERQKQKEYLQGNVVDRKQEEFYYNFSTYLKLPLNYFSNLNAANIVGVTEFAPFSIVFDLERFSTQSRYFWGLGLNYVQFKSSAYQFNATTAQLNYKTLIGNMKIGWIVFKSELFKINMTVGANISGDYRIEFSNGQKNKGQLLGINAETYAQIFPNWSWSIKTGVGISQNKVFAINNVTIPNSTTTFSETSYNSMYLFMAISKSL